MYAIANGGCAEKSGTELLHALQSTRGMIVAPHHLAAQAGLAVLREGGNAIEAMVAAAACIAVVYPHMNAIGGDAFWLIAEPGKAPIAIEGCGPAALKASVELYRAHGLVSIPSRGPMAALTVAGAVSSWEQALIVSESWGGQLPLSRLFEDAIFYAESGTPAPAGHCELVAAKSPEMGDAVGFRECFAPDGLPKAGALIRNERLGRTFRALASNGLDDFYRGALARAIAYDLERLGTPLTLADLEAYRAQSVRPLSLRVNGAELFNLPPPTQGIASLLILGQYDLMPAAECDGFDHVHRLVEATKTAFIVRDRVAIDPKYCSEDVGLLLRPEAVAAMRAGIDLKKAAPWPARQESGDTVWLGAIDSAGRAVSFIQSTYWEYGSGVVLPETGINWQNRGMSFSLDPRSHNCLMPGRKPFHTLNPAFVRFDDGRTMVFGTMGGDGQPQTQAAVFSRYHYYGMDLQNAIAAPRWLLGRTWGAQSITLKIEENFAPGVRKALEEAGHAVEAVSASNAVMGHAGAVLRDSRGVLAGAADPRSDGSAAGF